MEADTADVALAELSLIEVSVLPGAGSISVPFGSILIPFGNILVPSDITTMEGAQQDKVIIQASEVITVSLMRIP